MSLELWIEVTKQIPNFVWFILVFWLFLVFKDSIRNDILPNIKFLKLPGGIELELFTRRPAFGSTFFNINVRKAIPAIKFECKVYELLKHFEKETPSEYAVIDLGKGEEWPTSRLFLFSIMLKYIRGLQYFVFLESRGDVDNRFIGLASLDNVRTSISKKYCFLEKKFRELESLRVRDGYFKYFNPFFASGEFITADSACLITQYFLKNIQKKETPPQNEIMNWVEIEEEGKKIWEYAQWINRELLEDILDKNLNKSWVEESPDISRKEINTKILRREGHFIALVDEERRFINLVDRGELLKKIVKEISQP